MKTPQQASALYGSNGSSAASTQLWATNFSNNIDAILSAAIKAIPRWQANVATQLAADNMTKGLNRAKTKEAAIITKVKGVGMASLAAGVRAAAQPGGNYDAFIGPWMNAVGSQVQTLNTTNPRGTRADNRARQATYDNWVDQQAGKFRVV